jgi:hypothetical protein
MLFYNLVFIFISRSITWGYQLVVCMNYGTCDLKASPLSFLFIFINGLLCLSGSSTPGTTGCQLRPNKSRYDSVLFSDKRLRSQVPRIRYGPTAPG